MSIDRRIDKEDVVHIYNGILLSHKKERNNAICSNTDGPRDCHTEWSKSDRERQISYAITYMWNLKKWYKWIYSQNRNRVTDVENKLMVTRWEREGGGINWEIGIDIHTLLYIKQIMNKDLLYSKGNSTQYSIMAYMQKES